jgi:hypothetical protein
LLVFNGVLKQCGLDLTIIYVSTRVLEVWVMETTNIYNFLHLLSLIIIRTNMDLGGGGGEVGFGICTYMPQYFFLLFSQREWRKDHNQRPNKEVKDTPWLLFICLFHLVFFKLRLN